MSVHDYFSHGYQPPERDLHRSLVAIWRSLSEIPILIVVASDKITHYELKAKLNRSIKSDR
jgi:hypothetical protein